MERRSTELDRNTITLTTFPRSGTIFFGALIKNTFPNINFQWTHNAYGFRSENPITIVRKPNECVSSWIKHMGPNGVEESQRITDVINWYNRFYIRVLESDVVVFNFYSLIKDPSILIEYISNLTKEVPVKTKVETLPKNKNVDPYSFLSESDTRLKKSFDIYNQVVTHIFNFK